MQTFEHKGCEWYVNDTRGYIDEGPACDECGACECEDTKHPDEICVGLSVAYVCLDGGDALCEACARKEGIEA